MNGKRHTIVLAAVVLLMMLSLGGGVLAQTSPSYNLEWHTIGGGGGPASSASYALHGVVGQMLGADALSSSASYVVRGGYVVGFQMSYTIYLPLVSKG
jgi:hypothetical protein